MWQWRTVTSHTVCNNMIGLLLPPSPFPSTRPISIPQLQTLIGGLYNKNALSVIDFCDQSSLANTSQCMPDHNWALSDIPSIDVLFDWNLIYQDDHFLSWSFARNPISSFRLFRHVLMETKMMPSATGTKVCCSVTVWYKYNIWVTTITWAWY